MNIGRIVGVIAALLLLAGAAVFFFFRYSFSAEGLYRVKTAMGVDAAAPERHIVPAGFQGWAVLHFSVEGAPPLKAEDDALVVEYPVSGSLETSTPAHDDAGFLHREYFRSTADGLVPLSRMGEIWGEYNMKTMEDDSGSAIGRSSGFFVGTMAEFREAEIPHPGLELLELPEGGPD
jgi:hypothetical protein